MSREETCTNPSIQINGKALHVVVQFKAGVWHWLWLKLWLHLPLPQDNVSIQAESQPKWVDSSTPYSDSTPNPWFKEWVKKKHVGHCFQTPHLATVHSWSRPQYTWRRSLSGAVISMWNSSTGAPPSYSGSPAASHTNTNSKIRPDVFFLNGTHYSIISKKNLSAKIVFPWISSWQALKCYASCLFTHHYHEIQQVKM